MAFWPATGTDDATGTDEPSSAFWLTAETDEASLAIEGDAETCGTFAGRHLALQSPRKGRNNTVVANEGILMLGVSKERLKRMTKRSVLA